MKKIIALIALFMPSVAAAQLAPITDINVLSSRLLSIGNLVLYFLVALAVIFIVFNVVKYIIYPGEATEKPKAGWNIFWGIIGLFIIVSIWGLVNILTGTFSTTPSSQPAPNLTNFTEKGGLPINQLPVVR